MLLLFFQILKTPKTLHTSGIRTQIMYGHYFTRKYNQYMSKTRKSKMSIILKKYKDIK